MRSYRFEAMAERIKSKVCMMELLSYFEDSRSLNSDKKDQN